MVYSKNRTVERAFESFENLKDLDCWLSRHTDYSWVPQTTYTAPRRWKAQIQICTQVREV